jgi:hypothetical protein
MPVDAFGHFPADRLRGRIPVGQRVEDQVNALCRIDLRRSYESCGYAGVELEYANAFAIRAGFGEIMKIVAGRLRCAGSKANTTKSAGRQ